VLFLSTRGKALRARKAKQVISHRPASVSFARAHTKAAGSKQSSGGAAAVPVLKDPKKISKMLQKLQKARSLDLFDHSRC
jgi:hypothetical protein